MARRRFFSIFETLFRESQPSSDPAVRVNGQFQDHDLESILQKAHMSRWNLVSKIRELSTDREKVYKEYEAMANDVFIASALELYADDATQPDATGRIIWVTSEDPQLEHFLNSLLKELRIQSRIWNWAYNLALYGDLYIQLFRDREGKLERYIEEWANPATIFDLTRKGKTVYFGVLKDASDSKTSVELRQPDEFVHFYISRLVKSEDLKVSVPNANGEATEHVYKAIRGTPIIEPLRSSYRILRFLEDALILARINKSAFLQLFQIEVGNLPPKKVKELVSKFKRLIDAQDNIDLLSGVYSSSKTPGPFQDPIIVPVRNGQGSISHQTIGGDVDIGSVVDLDYFKNKIFAGLKVPKAFLGFEESLPGGMGTTALTKLDVRYARTVRRLQTALIEGVRTLLNLFLLDSKFAGSINNFEVHMVNPSSVEEMDRLSDLESRLRVAEALLAILDSERAKYIKGPEFVKYVFTHIIDLPDIEKLIRSEEEIKSSRMRLRANFDEEEEYDDTEEEE